MFNYIYNPPKSINFISGFILKNSFTDILQVTVRKTPVHLIENFAFYSVFCYTKHIESNIVMFLPINIFTIYSPPTFDEIHGNMLRNEKENPKISIFFVICKWHIYGTFQTSESIGSYRSKRS